MTDENTRVRQLPGRQGVRRASLLLSFLLFPITLYYFSPMLILQGASERIVNGSFIVFGLQFLSALAVGRLWCGWACPAGALQEIAAPINNRRVGGRANWIKWIIWVPWTGLIAFLAVGAGGYRAVALFYQIPGGLTLAIPPDPQGPPWYLIYYIIVGLFVALPAAFGRRTACHAICWMAPFMILGRKVRNLVRWPALHLQADAGRCIDCLACTRGCPMSLDVHGLVHSGDMEHSECILCGTCVDNCPRDVIHYAFSGGK